MFQDEGFKVARADIVQDRNGRSKGFGTVTFDNDADAEAAINRFEGAMLEGRPLSVKFDKFA